MVLLVCLSTRRSAKSKTLRFLLTLSICWRCGRMFAAYFLHSFILFSCCCYVSAYCHPLLFCRRNDYVFLFPTFSLTIFPTMSSWCRVDFPLSSVHILYSFIYFNHKNEWEHKVERMLLTTLIAILSLLFVARFAFLGAKSIPYSISGFLISFFPLFFFIFHFANWCRAFYSILICHTVILFYHALKRTPPWVIVRFWRISERRIGIRKRWKYVCRRSASAFFVRIYFMAIFVLFLLLMSYLQVCRPPFAAISFLSHIKYQMKSKFSAKAFVSTSIWYLQNFDTKLFRHSNDFTASQMNFNTSANDKNGRRKKETISGSHKFNCWISLIAYFCTRWKEIFSFFARCI